ncbi:hypothetical protein J3R83DRAFT_7806 [Lanmaoa asiatica]|nr:hypothetical protein J3R83DRAFT_7806 [Lanmaoa asiatica]
MSSLGLVDSKRWIAKIIQLYLIQKIQWWSYDGRFLTGKTLNAWQVLSALERLNGTKGAVYANFLLTSTTVSASL